MDKKILIIFTKNPELGSVKTRLAATIGDARALAVYQQLVAHTQRITAGLEADKVVFYGNFIDHNDLWHGAHYQKQVQLQSPDLGERMRHAFEWAAAAGYQHIGIVGCDCVELTPQILAEGMASLAQNDACIGGAEDGGYYFLATKGVVKQVFEHKKWSTQTVFEDTINDLRMLDKTYHLLPILSDIDTENDLIKCGMLY